MTPFGLLTISLVLYSLSQAVSEVNYIHNTSDSSVPCTEQPCLTLSQFAANSSRYVLDLSSTTMILFSGAHPLRGANLSLSNMDSFEMKSENSIAQIECARNSHFSFNGSQHIHITNLEFIGCGGNQVKHVQEFVVNNTKFDGHDVSGAALELIETTAQIINSTFISNGKDTFRKCAQFEVTGISDCNGTNDTLGGGAIISTNSAVNISHSVFEDNRAINGGANNIITINITSVPCTEQPCQTLTFSQFAANSSRYVHPFTTLLFSSGKHYLSDVNLSLSDLESLIMKSENLTAQIECTNISSLLFSRIQHIQITNLEFIGCGGN